MRYFILGAHGGIAYHAALRILEQDGLSHVCTFLVPTAESELWTSDPRLARFRAAKSALIVYGDVNCIEDVQRAWHVAEMGIDSESSGIEAVIVSDMSSGRKTNDADQLLSILKCFPCFPYPPPLATLKSRSRQSYQSYAAQTRSRTTSLHHFARSPSYSSRSPRLILISPARSLIKQFRAETGAASRNERLVAWATGQKPAVDLDGVEPESNTPVDSLRSLSSESARPKVDSSSRPGWLDPKDTLVVKPASLIRKRCRGDNGPGSVMPYCIYDQEGQEHHAGWTISKRDVAHFVVERALAQWPSWGGRRVRIAY